MSGSSVVYVIVALGAVQIMLIFVISIVSGIRDDLKKTNKKLDQLLESRPSGTPADVEDRK